MVAFRRLLSDRDRSAMETAATHWQRGDKALANLRLVFADLPRLTDTQDAVRLKAAELLFDAGLRTDDLAVVFEVEPSATDLGKYDPNQPRVPAGSGATSGQWTSGLWARVSAWLDEEVPVHDQDTGAVVGTQSRARAILTSPLTVGSAGAAALLGGEALLPAAAADAATVAVPAAEESETLTPFAQQYLSRTGGRLGGTTTRQQLYEIAQEHYSTGRYVNLQGDGYGPEEFLQDPLTGRGTYVDFTAESVDGTTVRIQTIDTLADGVTPTARELSAASRIRALRPNDALTLIPKQRP